MPSWGVVLQLWRKPILPPRGLALDWAFRKDEFGIFALTRRRVFASGTGIVAVITV
jgi:hypothetical protein